MNAVDYQLDVWAPVTNAPKTDPHISAIQVSRSGAGAFSVVVRDADGVFDFWLESEQELIEYLDTMSIDWRLSAGE